MAVRNVIVVWQNGYKMLPIVDATIISVASRRYELYSQAVSLLHRLPTCDKVRDMATPRCALCNAALPAVQNECY